MRPSIPKPTLESASNLTPFADFQCQKMGKGRVFFDCVVIKASYELAPGRLVLAEEQGPVELSDSYFDNLDASRSSVQRAGDLHAPKPGADVVVTGTARPPEGRPAASWDCQVIVHEGSKPLLNHRLRATGPRRWEKRLLGGWSISEPAPTTEVPVRYELAYGGHHERGTADDGSTQFAVYKANPSGTGFFDERRMDGAATYPAPQWELPTEPVTAVNRDSPLAGLGPVARMWASRTRYGGTYDDAWLSRRRADLDRGDVADYPTDFDPRFFQVAHPALQSAAPLAGGEGILLRGLVAEHPELSLQLPATRPIAELLGRVGPWKERALPLDTVHVDLDARRVHIVWRLALDPADGIGAAVITSH